MKKLIGQYTKASDLFYLFLCMLCSLLSVATLASIGGNMLGGFETDAISGEISGMGGYRYAIVQLCSMAIGLAAAIFLSCIDYRALVQAWPIHTAFTLLLTLPTIVFRNLALGPVIIGYCPEGTDNYSWYKLGGVTFQPSELLKISFILTFAMHLAHCHGSVNRPGNLFRLVLHWLAPVALIHIQGDDGSAMVFAAIGAGMLFAAGISARLIAFAVGAGGIALGAVALFFSDRFLKSYQMMRILAVLYPDDPQYKDYALQQTQGKISIGSGRILGTGLFSADHNYVANSWNDFLFSYLAECIGFVGCCVVLLLLFSIMWRTLATGFRSSDRVGTYICVGVFSAILFQTLINLGMNLSLLPVIGITLPFFSGGGTSVLMLYLCIGLVLSVYIHNKKDIFEE